MKYDKNIFRFAQEIVCALEKNAKMFSQCTEMQFTGIGANLDKFIKLLRKADLAEAKSYYLASKRLQISMGNVLKDVDSAIPFALERLNRKVPSIPKVSDVVAELHDLFINFDKAYIDQTQMLISVETEPITLEDISLGPFRIELNIMHLNDLAQNRPYTCIATEPNPSSVNEEVTHPHINGGYLCEGEGFHLIRTALQEGRLNDFFNIIISILQTYNPDSPYVSLSEWDGKQCYDCGYTCGNDDSYYCQFCDYDYCESCSSYCRVCEETVCFNCGGKCSNCETFICSCCAVKCPQCDEHSCEDCMTCCPVCDRTCCKNCLTNDMCPTCNEERNCDENAKEKKETEYLRVMLAVQPDSMGQNTVLQGQG